MKKFDEKILTVRLKPSTILFLNEISRAAGGKMTISRIVRYILEKEEVKIHGRSEYESK